MLTTKISAGRRNPMILIIVLLLTLGWNSAVLAQAPFYQGKTITIVVGTKAGDVYDLYPRLLSEFMPKYIPGNPNIIIQNVPGAASLIAANQVYNVGKPDGLTIGAIYPALYFQQMIKRPEVKFDWNKFGWIGSTVTSNHLIYIRHLPVPEALRRSSWPPASSVVRWFFLRGFLRSGLKSCATRSINRSMTRLFYPRQRSAG